VRFAACSFVARPISISESAASQIIVIQSIGHGIRLEQLSHSVLFPFESGGEGEGEGEGGAGAKGGRIYCCLTPGNFFDK